MNKAEMIEQIAQAAEISKSAAERAIDAMVVAVKSNLKKGNMVTLVGFTGAVLAWMDMASRLVV